MPFVDMNGYERLLFPATIFILKTLMDDRTVKIQKFKKELGMKDDSLWSNMRNLEEMGFITMGKEIYESGRETYSITEKGRSAYLDLRARLIRLL